MAKSTLLGIAGVTVAIVMANPAAAATNLINNGSFESAGNGTFGSPAGVADWSTSGTAGDSYYPVAIQYNQASGYPTGAQGESVPTDNASSLSPDGAGSYGVYFVSDQATNLTISQEVYLTPGSYDIGFDSYFTLNGFMQPGDAVFTADIAGVKLADIDLASVVPGAWTTHEGEADILTAGNYLVSFTFNTPDAPENAKDVVIDQAYIVGSNDGGGIPISAAPEPSTWFLMMAGLAAIGLGFRRLRKGGIHDRELRFA